MIKADVFPSPYGLIRLLKLSLKSSDNAFFIGTADSPLQVLEMQLEGKKRMPASDFIRGTAITDGAFTEI